MSRRKEVSQGRKSGNRRLFLEQLEQRNLMAGLVTVEVLGNSLIITGDSADNVIQVVEVEDGDFNDKTHAYVVGGAVDPNDSENSTRIRVGRGGVAVTEGLPDFVNQAGIFRNVKFDVNIRMNGGNDVVGVGNSTQALIDLAVASGFPTEMFGFPQDAGTIEGAGEGTLEVPRSLLIDMGDGRNDFEAVVAIANVGGGNIGGIAKITTGLSGSGRSTDFVAVGNSTVGGPRNRGADLLIFTGNGDDQVSLSDFSVQDLLQVNTGNGSDVVLINDDGDGGDGGSEGGSDGGGDGEISTALHALIETGNGSDDVVVYDLVLRNAISVFTQGSDKRVLDADEVELYNISTSLMHVLTGKDGDTVEVENGETPNPVAAVIRDLIINTDSGQDFVDLIDLIITRDAKVLLGADSDNLEVSGINDDGLNNKGRNVFIDAGSGDDFISIEDAHFDQFDSRGRLIGGTVNILMGAGNDTLSISLLSSSAKTITLDGGPPTLRQGGRDTLLTDGLIEDNVKLSEGGRTLTVKNFEFFTGEMMEEEENT